MATVRNGGQTADVAIVGGGPVGLGLAIELAQRGVTSRVLERTTELHRIPKGQNLTQRTGEHFRAWGLSQAVRDASPIPPEFGNAGIVAYRTLLGDYTCDWFKRSVVRPFYFADNERLPQYDLERVMRARAAELPQIEFETGATVTGVRQDENGVSVEYSRAGDDAANTLRAAYAVGCDGARSTLRREAGIELATDNHERRMALLVFRSSQLHDLLERYPGKTIYNVLDPDHDGYWQFLGRVDLEGGWFFHAPVPAGTTAENFDFHAYLHRVVGEPFALEFEHIGFWDLRIAHAKTYRAGRLFIAGDAGHSHPPYGGYGVNTGLEDARNLGWKLAAHLKGWGGAGLLDSYGAERHPVFASTAADFIDRMIRDDRAFSRTHSPERDRAAFEAEWNRRAGSGNADVTQFLPNYAGSPIVFGEQGAVSNACGTHAIEAKAGYHLAPQPLPDGRDLWEALGSGYALLDFTGSAEGAAAFKAAADHLGVPLSVLSAPSEDLRAAYGCDRVLVRPDLFIAWTGQGEDAGAVLAKAVGAAPT